MVLVGRILHERLPGARAFEVGYGLLSNRQLDTIAFLSSLIWFYEYIFWMSVGVCFLRKETVCQCHLEFLLQQSTYYIILSSLQANHRVEPDVGRQ